ncbi:DUF1376 domain-containing protein [Burkholderia thailandensis]|uniref:YdaU family protein n=1 Tax=Burkholderia thailandensis TaxID=57975 RepID=UPI00137697F7|nr:YdaU family protein [Burkholderia thailandensis]NBJ19747.1 DUF1376 domain-containing protein [Burkholderia thailandensis]
MNFYKHHIGDYDADTSHLSWDEDMAYTRMIRTYYRREKPLPEDVKEVCRLVRATSRVQREAVQAVLGEFFSLEADGWHQKRCDGELAEANRKAEQNRTVGKLGGRPRKTQNPEETQTVSEQKPTNNPDGFDSVSRNNPSQTPDSRLQTPDVGYAVAQGDPPRETSDDFAPRNEADWQRYFRDRHGVLLNERSTHDRKKAWPLFAAWAKAGITVAQMDAAVAKAQSEATEPIAFLPAYVDRVIATMGASPRASPQQRSYHDERADVIAQLTGRKAAHQPAADGVIDVDCPASHPRLDA